MALSPLEKRLDTYRRLMLELKQRHVGVAKILRGEHELEKWLVQDICYLQFRLMCELIALGCLVMHGDITEANSSRLRDAHEADKIINLLSKLHPSFYPRPIEATPQGEAVKGPDGKIGQRFSLADIKDESVYLTKSDLVNLWRRECGRRLHAGTLNTLGEPREKFDPAPLYAWASKFTKLLNIHCILPKDEQHVHVVFMQGITTGGVEITPMSLSGGEDGSMQYQGGFPLEMWKPPSDDQSA